MTVAMHVTKEGF